MFVALVENGADLPRVLVPMLVDLDNGLTELPQESQPPGLVYLARARSAMHGRRYYEAADSMLELAAVIKGTVGPDRVNWSGESLCRVLRRHFPQAPDGFEKTGRQSSPARDRRRYGELGEEPIGPWPLVEPAP